MSSNESTEQKIDKVLKSFLIGYVDHKGSPNQLHDDAKQALLSLIAEAEDRRSAQENEATVANLKKIKAGYFDIDYMIKSCQLNKESNV
ncbi:MAG: hypothetical protein EOO17_00865 [Chloroflexi bacterium]|nr:MAG: hypothetical protein EOO17_00865 [Chloroflexota bacterium]